MATARTLGALKLHKRAVAVTRNEARLPTLGARLRTVSPSRDHRVVLCCAHRLRVVAQRVASRLRDKGFATEVRAGADGRDALLAQGEDSDAQTIHVLCLHGSLDFRVADPLRKALASRLGSRSSLVLAVLDPRRPFALANKIRRIADLLESQTAVPKGDAQKQTGLYSVLPAARRFKVAANCQRGDTTTRNSRRRPKGHTRKYGTVRPTSPAPAITVTRPTPVPRPLARTIPTAIPNPIPVSPRLPARIVAAVAVVALVTLGALFVSHEGDARGRSQQPPTAGLAAAFEAQPATRGGEARVAGHRTRGVVGSSTTESERPTARAARTESAPDDSDYDDVTEIVVSLPRSDADHLDASVEDGRLQRIGDLYVSATQGDATTWGEARRRCRRLEVDGVGQWRLPYRRELKLLGLAATLDRDQLYWSSSTVEYDLDYAWALDPQYEPRGDLIELVKADTTAAALCVRK